MQLPTLSLLDDAIRRLHMASSSRNRLSIDRPRRRIQTLSAAGRTRSPVSILSPPHRPLTTSSMDGPCPSVHIKDVHETPHSSNQLEAAMKAHESFKTEVHSWRTKQGPPFDKASAANFADYLTEKYLSTQLDTLGRAQGISRIRRSIASQIDAIVEPQATTTTRLPIDGQISPDMAQDDMTWRLQRPLNPAVDELGNPWGGGTAWQTINEAKRFIRGGNQIRHSDRATSPAAATKVTGGDPSRVDQLIPQLSGHLKAAASPAEAASNGGPVHAEPVQPLIEGSIYLQRIWVCVICAKKNAGATNTCGVCGRSKDATLVTGVQRPGIPTSGVPLLQKLMAFQKVSVRADKDAVKCEELGREIEDVLYSLRAMKASPAVNQN